MTADDANPEDGLSYRAAGVDIGRQDQALARIKELVASTRTPGVLSEVGHFGGLFALDVATWRKPVLVSSCDGVGTKLRVAFATGVHDSVGRDLVNHCVNDILVQGARPLFFLDYVATGRLEPHVVIAVVEGIARGCREAGCALLGGELAEMPGFYADGEYDIAGFIVGVVEASRLIDGRGIRPGDQLLGLPSAGLHTNGYSLARKVFFEIAGLAPHDHVAELGDTVCGLLLAEHRSYLPALSELVDAGRLRGLAHITGGGLVDNLPRILPLGTAARVRRGSWPVPPLYDWIERVGRIPQAEMEHVFNMGIGMVAVVAEDQLAAVTGHFEQRNEACYLIGEIVEGDRRVIHV